MSDNNLVVKRNEKAIEMSRVFNAPRDLVWKVYTDPELMPKWWGPRSTKTVIDKMDLRPGGQWRYIHHDGEGNEYGFNGVYQEVNAPEMFSYTFEFEPMAGHICVETVTFEEVEGDKTKITTTTVFDNLDDLDAMLQSGMESGAVETWDRLEDLLQTVPA